MKTRSFIFTLILIITWSVSLGAIEVSVKSYGAKGDGRTDDRAAIQAAVDAVYKAGGGIVNFPAGVYIVKALKKGVWEPQVRIYNNLKLQGEGMFKSIIKVADSQGPWDVILTGDSITNFRMIDIGMDGNGATNPLVTDKDDFGSPWLHTLVYLPNSKDVYIERCRFTNLSGVWAIYILRQAENILIDNCLFDNIGGYTKNDWDHSCIRIDGYGPTVVSNNVMTTRFGAGTTGARTAIELHGSNHKFINNYISGFRYGVNVCSGKDDFETSVHQYYVDNKFVSVGCGLAIWGIGNKKFDNLVFERNDITIDIAGWKNVFPEFYGIGIVSYLPRTTPPVLIKNMKIIDNQITFINTDPDSKNHRSYGIRLDHSPHPESGLIENSVIKGNVISRSYLSGIYINFITNNLEISDNVIINPGQADAAQGSHAAIKLDKAFRNSSIINNYFYIDDKTKGIYGIYDSAEHPGGFIMRGNEVRGNAAGDALLYLKKEP